MNNKTDITVAKTIFSQISAWTKIRCAAREFVAHENALQFRVTVFSKPRKKHFINVTLTPADVYDVTLLELDKNLDIHTIETCEGVYCDQLNKFIDDLCA